MNDAFMLACTASQWLGDPATCRWCGAALTGRQERWCSRRCSSTAAANHFWTSARARARKRDGQSCVRCHRSDAHARLEVHHRDTRAEGRHDKTGCWHHIDGLETLCRDCHVAEHGSPNPVDQLSLAEAI